MSEIWKLILGYDGLYEVSDKGNVRSYNSRWGRRTEPKLLKPGRDSSGYPSVVLCKRGVQRNVTIHILVAEAFIGPRPKGTEVNHIDGDKTNNHVSNLEYVTDSENTRHARDVLGNSGIQLLSYQQAEEIIALLTQGKLMQIEICELYGVANTTIANIWIGSTWSDLPRQYPPNIRYSVWRKMQLQGTST